VDVVGLQDAEDVVASAEEDVADLAVTEVAAASEVAVVVVLLAVVVVLVVVAAVLLAAVVVEVRAVAEAVVLVARVDRT
jgi:hypothetical protein